LVSQVSYNNKTYSLVGISRWQSAQMVLSQVLLLIQLVLSTVTQNAMQVDSNGNITGSSGFTVGTVNFSFTWQGKVTVTGNVISIQGTWTGQYGSGVFSGTGTTSN